MVKILTVLVSTILDHRYFCCKNVSSFCKCKSYSHFFSKNISIYAIFNDQSFNDTLSNDIFSFEQLGPDCLDVKDGLSHALKMHFHLAWPYTCIATDKRGYPHTIFLISPLKHMLWVLIRST